MGQMGREIRWVVPWRRATAVLVGGAAILMVVSGVLFVLFAALTPGTASHGLVRELWLLVDVGSENNIPTW